LYLCTIKQSNNFAQPTKRPTKMQILTTETNPTPNNRAEQIAIWVEEIYTAATNGYLSTPKGLKAAKRAASKVKTAAHTGIEGQKVKLSTFLSYLTDVRKAIEQRFEGTEIAAQKKDFVKNLLSVLVVNKSEKQAILEAQSNYREKIEMRTGVELTDLATPHQNLSEELAPIFEPNELIGEAQKVIKNELGSSKASYLKIACALMLLTGRRATEILKTGEFSAIPNEPKKLLFKGQLKVKKRAEKEDFADTYIIPTLCEASQILEGFEAMRTLAKETRLKNNVQDFADMSNDKVGVTTANILGQYARKLFGDWLGSNISSHNLRKAYLAVARHQYKTEFAEKMQAFEQSQIKQSKGKKAPKTNTPAPILESMESFARSILGHAGGNGNGEKIVDLTTRTYLFYKVVSTPKPETVQPTIPNQSEGTETTETKQPPVTLRIIELIEPLLNSKEKTAINQYTIKNLFFDKYQKYPDAISMNTVLTGVTKSKNPQIIAAVLGASTRIQKHNETLAKPRKK
jgi:Telomere resolvase